MHISKTPPPPGKIATPPDLPRTERLMAAMHHVFSHDLPNQLVVVQSLIAFLREEEGSLSAEGREVLQRLSRASQRAGNMVHFLKDISRLSKMTETIEDIRLSALAREVQAELTHLYPQRELRLETDWQVPALFAGRRSLHQATVQLLRAGIDNYPTQAMTLQLASQTSGKGVEIRIGAQPQGPLLPNDPPARQDRALPEERLEFILAREALAIWGGSLAAVREPGRPFHFVVVVPGLR